MKFPKPSRFSGVFVFLAILLVGGYRGMLEFGLAFNPTSSEQKLADVLTVVLVVLNPFGTLAAVASYSVKAPDWVFILFFLVGALASTYVWSVIIRRLGNLPSVSDEEDAGSGRDSG